jgi:hypothetical protein
MLAGGWAPLARLLKVVGIDAVDYTCVTACWIVLDMGVGSKSAITSDVRYHTAGGHCLKS